MFKKCDVTTEAYTIVLRIPQSVGVARATCPAAHSDSHVNGKKSPFEGVIPGAKWRKRDGKSRPSVWRDPKKLPGKIAQEWRDPKKLSGKSRPQKWGVTRMSEKEIKSNVDSEV